MLNLHTFDPMQARKECVEWIQDWFARNGPDCNAVLGLSGGKDSTVAAALCAEALGPDRVIGVMMPNGVQHDINDSLAVADALGIHRTQVNIGDAISALYDNITLLYREDPARRSPYREINITAQTHQNLPPRIRMAALYAVSQSCNGRVVNTCNLSESIIGWETRWGDAVGDFSPLADLTASEVIAIGLTYENLPRELVVKPPADGLCGKTDEDAFGFTYDELDKYIRTGEIDNPESKALIDKKIQSSRFKRRAIPKYGTGLPSIPD